MTNKTYDFIKDFALLSPFVIAFIIAIIHAWNVPYAPAIDTTLVALNGLIGGVVKWAKAKHDNAEKEFNPVALDELMNGKGED